MSAAVPVKRPKGEWGRNTRKDEGVCIRKKGESHARRHASSQDQSGARAHLPGAGDTQNEYHVEAAIASIHARARRTEETDWKTIVSLYDTPLAIRPSPIVALNRAIAVAQNEGPDRALAEIRALAGVERLAGDPFYHAALGEFELRRGNHEQAREHFRAALALARNPMERHFLDQRIAPCERAAPA